MKPFYENKVVWGVLGIGAGIVVTTMALIFTVRTSIVREARSPYDFATTVQTIRDNAATHGWKVSLIPALQRETSDQADQKLPAIEVMQLCHPDYTCGLLAFGKNRCVAMMPYTVVVYEQDDAVYVSYLNTPALGRFFRRETAGPMRSARHDEREILGFLAKR